MANTTYVTLCDRFFDKVKDYMFNSLDEDISYQIAKSYIPSACLKYKGCTFNLSDRDDVLEEFNFELGKNDIEILANYMVIAYLDSNFIVNANVLKTRLSSTDFHSLRQPEVLAKAIEVRTLLQNENEQLTIDKSYEDTHIFDMVLNRSTT